ncbi:NAD(P)-dependent alcohol dehydrogenase [Devosia nitrariae]|uniref:NADPH:quinone reductase n=1 Tax=Devosia nitrariae TaxID=2071872 RepID=A0ABQ5WCC0_9HYPH|nr:NAD(P)-dependent alcohol dehydrogenase [Devosia nitrariae]GLQ57785.1 NADPH:quinone reductase [Devosia nitrariae]
MKALIYTAYGPPETLRLEDVPVPEPEAGEVLVCIVAASINSWDWDLMVGSPLGRIGSPFKPPRKVLGADIAGTVVSVGTGVERLKPGDAVFGDLSEGNWGGFAEYVAAKADALALKPDTLGFAEAAALPQAGLLALKGLQRRALKAGDRVLLNGAGGGVGTFAIQIAKAAGAHVTAVDCAEKRETLLALGADRFIDYREDDFTAEGERYDLVLDVVARRSVFAFSRVLTPGGHLVVIGGSIGTLLQVAALGSMVGRKHGQRLELLMHKPAVADLDDLAARCVKGELKPVIDSTWPLAEGAAALRRLGDGLAIGKVVITMPTPEATGTPSRQSS